MAGAGVLGAATAYTMARARSGGLFAERPRNRFRGGWRDRAEPVARWVGGRHARRHELAQTLGGLGGWWPTLMAGAVAAVVVGRRHGVAPAAPVVVAVPLAGAAHAAIKYTVRRPRPLTARLTGKRTPSFPSGHAARAAAAAGIIGYAAVRDEAIPSAAAVALGSGIALAAGASRIYVDRHWATDLVGGWALGATTGALCALWYDRLRGSGA